MFTKPTDLLKNCLNVPVFSSIKWAGCHYLHNLHFLGFRSWSALTQPSLIFHDYFWILFCFRSFHEIFSFLHFSALSWRINWVLIFKRAVLNTTIFSQVFIFCISTTRIMERLTNALRSTVFSILRFLHFILWMFLLFSRVRNIRVRAGLVRHSC